jgi:hypothetical protein
MPLDPVSLAAILQQLQQQGGQGNQGAGIPPAQVSPQPPMPGQAQGMPPPQAAANPLMQMAQKAMSNPQAQTIPQPPAAPSTSSAHPVLAQIMQALSSGMQNFGYGMQTGPQQLQRQALDAQKSEAMARLGMEQAQLAETQRFHTGTLGEESKRTAIEGKRQEQEAQYQTGQLGLGARRATTEEAAQKETAGYHTKEFEQRQKELDLQHKQLDEQIRHSGVEEKLGGARIGVEQQANVLKQKQLDLDKDKIQQTFQIQGLANNRETMEKERAGRLAAIEDHYKEHSWWTLWGGLAGRQKDVDAVNQDIDAREAQAATAAGVPSFTGSVPPIGSKLNPNPQVSGPQQGDGGTKPARFVNGKWVDATTNQPITPNK